MRAVLGLHGCATRRDVGNVVDASECRLENEIQVTRECNGAVENAVESVCMLGRGIGQCSRDEVVVTR